MAPSKKRKYEEAFQSILSKGASDTKNNDRTADGSGDAHIHGLREPGNVNEVSSIHTRSSLVLQTDWSLCILCQQAYRKRSKKVSLVSEQSTLSTLSRIANANVGEDIGGLLSARIADGLICHRAVYHQDCFKSYLKLIDTHIATSSLVPVDPYETSFQNLLSTCGCKVMEQHEIFFLTQLLEEYRRLLAEFDIFTPYQSKRLKKRLIQHYGDRIVFDSGTNQRESELVFSSDIPLASALRKIRELMREIEDLRRKQSVSLSESSSVNAVAGRVIAETKNLKTEFTHYEVYISKESADFVVSLTLSELLAQISPKLNKTLPSILIGNIVTSVLTGRPTDLQIALGVELRDSATNLNLLHAFLVTSTYDEVRRFLKSAALDASENADEYIEFDSSHGLVETVIDNFDQEFWSIQGKSTLHVMAMIAKQNGPAANDESKVIRRISKPEMTTTLNNIMEISQDFKLREKRPSMPILPIPTTDAELEHRKDISRQRAQDLDLRYLERVSSDEPCPQYNGYNTMVARENGFSPNRKSSIKYLPLLDNPATDPATVKATMHKTELICKLSGQNFSVMTADLQLYRISTYILWQSPSNFSQEFLVRLGGMHMLMSYVGCIGDMMAGTGLAEVMSSTFSSVDKMMSGKLYPQNVRALRLAAEEVLRPLISTVDIAELPAILDDLTRQSRTAKMWIENLIKPVFLIMRYVRSEREADWALHLDCVNSMLDMFFAAGHYNYARFGLYYLRSMESMSPELRKHFIAGEHAVYLSDGVFNGVWTDQGIESTYMKFGKGKKGIGRTALRPESQRQWAYSADATTTVSHSVRSLSGNGDVKHAHKHRDETNSRMEMDMKDKSSLRSKLSLAINPLDPAQHPSDGLVNILTGYVELKAGVNVDKSSEIGHSQRVKFGKNLPAGFHDPISKQVLTMKPSKNSIRVGQKLVFDTQVIYLRAMVLSQDRTAHDLSTETLLTYELAPVPTSMFADDGSMRTTKKSDLKNKLKVTVETTPNNVNAAFLDGCAILWTIPWPKDTLIEAGKQRRPATVKDYLDNCLEYLVDETRKRDTYLIMDR